MKLIKSILVEGIGYIYAEKQVDNKEPAGTYHMEKNPIERIWVNGEMAKVAWYKQGNKTWNGKYVIEIEYFNIKKVKGGK